MSNLPSHFPMTPVQCPLSQTSRPMSPLTGTKPTSHVKLTVRPPSTTILSAWAGVVKAVRSHGMARRKGQENENLFSWVIQPLRGTKSTSNVKVTVQLPSKTIVFAWTGVAKAIRQKDKKSKTSIILFVIQPLIGTKPIKYM